MNPDGTDLTFEDSIREAMAALPAPVRNYLAQGKYTAVAKDLSSKYELHIDQGGVLEREIMLLVLGAEEPQDFLTSLKTEASLTEDRARAILADINTLVFVPLREEMMHASRPASVIEKPTQSRPVMFPPVRPPAPPAPAYQPKPVAPSPSSSLRDALQSVVHQPMPPATPPVVSKPSVPAAPPATAVPQVPTENVHEAAPLPPKMILPQSRPANMPPRPAVMPAPQPLPSKPAPVASVPAIRPGHAVNLLAKEPQEGSTPAPTTSPAPLTRDAAWPPPRPVAAALPVVTPPAPVAQPASDVPAPTPAKPANPLTKAYSLDPYREPIE